MKGAGEIGFTIVSLTVSLIAVLIPLLFMQEVVGRLFREFAVTLAVTILISAVVSLTLVPMLCAKLLRSHAVEEKKRNAASSAAPRRYYERLVAGYDRLLIWVLQHQKLTLLVAIGTLVLTVRDVCRHPQGLLPAAGHRLHPGHHRGRPHRVLRRHGRSASSSWPPRSCRIPMWPACRPSSAWTAPTTR